MTFETTTKTDPENLSDGELIAALSAANSSVISEEGCTFVRMPEGYTLVNITDQIEKYLLSPSRKKGFVQVHDLNSMVAYCKDQAHEDRAYIYADAEELEITGVMNDNRDGPGWRDHRVYIKFEKHLYFDQWESIDGEYVPQYEFAEFIEDNSRNLSGETGSKMLEVATTIHCIQGITFKSAKRLHDGQSQLVYTEQNEAKAGTDGTLEIPSGFTIITPIFKDDAFATEFVCRFKYRRNATGVSFRYQILDKEDKLKKAFLEKVEGLKSALPDYQVLMAKAPPFNVTKVGG